MKNGKYWDKAWSLVEGCTPVSEACDNCWLASVYSRFRHTYYKEGTIEQEALTDGQSFNGHIVVRPDRLEIPLKRKKPTVWAVWSDLFHENVKSDFRWQALQAMSYCPQHIFLVLTKRPKAIKNLFDVVEIYSKMVTAASVNQIQIFKTYKKGFNNIYWGTTAENQQRADERIPALLKVPGKQFLSLEPLLSGIDLSEYLYCGGCGYSLEDMMIHGDHRLCKKPTNIVNAVIVGAESGPGRRECNIEWVRSIVKQCKAAGTPVFVKQIHINGKLVKDIDQFPKDLRIRQLPWLKA